MDQSAGSRPASLSSIPLERWDAGTLASSVTFPRTEGEIRQAAATLDVSIPDSCMPGVIANLALLGRHAEALLGRELRLG